MMSLKKKQHSLITYCTTILLACTAVFSCTPPKNTVSQKSAPSTSSYQNPVFEPILADPSAVFDKKTGYYYAYGTEDNWGDGQGSRLVPIVRSKNLVDWQYVGQAFDKKPNWKQNGGIWAPDVNMINNQYYMYYSYSTWGDPNPGIGLAIATKPEGPFVDQGKLFTSNEISVPNSIDPSYYEYKREKFLIWGSFSNHADQGIHIVKLSPDGKKLHDHNKVKLAAGDWEAALIHKKGQFFYFFGSKGSCCEGANSKYHVLVARSENLHGPYLDKDGKDIRERGNGSTILKGNDKIAGPGHHSKLIEDKSGKTWFLYHAIDINNDKVSTGASRRMLFLDEVKWEDGWPLIEGGVPSLTEKTTPLI